MVKIIISGSFKIPNDLHPSQAELIKGMLKMNPNDRISTDAILINDWVKRGATKRMVNTPKVSSHKLSDIILKFDRKSEITKQRIFSPFSQSNEPVIITKIPQSRSMGTFGQIVLLNPDRTRISPQKRKITRPNSQMNLLKDLE
jgi:serine/threonine protein kinase